MEAFGVPPPADVVTHCRRELFHAVIELILKGQLAEAYKHGILIEFPDGVTRRVFPRFYSYSADYPEKSVTLCRMLGYSLTSQQGSDCNYEEPGPVPLPTLRREADRGPRPGKGGGQSATC